MLGDRMANRHDTPLRSSSPDTFLRQTRIGAAIALLVLAAAVASDIFDDRPLWAKHALITDVVASIVVIVLTLGVFNELVERRDRRRWAVLAQYVLLDLVRTARATWTGLLELAGLTAKDDDPNEALAAGARVVHDEPRLRASMDTIVGDPKKRRSLQRALTGISRYGDEALGRWAPVMLNASIYTEVIDRHVELYSRIAWVDSLLAGEEPEDDDPRRRRLYRASPAVELQGEVSDALLSNMLVAIAQLAEGLDRTTLALAIQLVPLEWWAERTPRPSPEG